MNRFSSRSHRPPARARLHGGLTLVEMLIAMVITLVMMAAVVNVFANLSGGVRDRRAMIDLGAQLRYARELMNRDLQNATCNGLTWQRPDEGRGFIEIIEGVRTDWDPSILLVPGLTFNLSNGSSYTTSTRLPPESLIPGSQLAADPVTGDKLPSDGLALGDWDDLLMLTVRSNGEPYRGRAPRPVFTTGANPTFDHMEVQPVESPLAEVIWFAAEEGTTPVPVESNEIGMRQIYRRVLVIAPWVDLSNVGALTAPQFFQRYDVSAHWDAAKRIWVANTLGDLTKRESRYFHDATNLDTLNGTGFPQPRTFPHIMIRPEPLVNIGSANSGNNYSALYPSRSDVWLGSNLEPGSSSQGQDLVLNDSLAFDVRVFDPGAPQIVRNGSDVVLQPGDRGWHLQRSAQHSTVGYGAYVDLAWDENWNRSNQLYRSTQYRDTTQSSPATYNYRSTNYSVSFLSITGTPPEPQYEFSPANPYALSLIQFPPPTGAVPAGLPVTAFPTDQTYYTQLPYLLGPSVTYDTWSFHYEHDGINQDQDIVYVRPAGAPSASPYMNANNNTVPLVDEGTNGIDDVEKDPTNPYGPPATRLMTNGVDDISERETAPPYDFPLRGIQVKLRVYERDARQVREATALRSFIP